MKTAIFLLVCLIFLAEGVSHALEAERVWTSSDGKTVTGTIIALEEDQITLEARGQKFEFPLSRLSEEDQAYAREWKQKATMPAEENPSQTVGKFENLELGEWPSSVAADFDLDKIEIVKEDEEAEVYIYRSPHFEFESPLRLSKSVVREFSRIFEATFEFAKMMPIGLAPKPSTDGHYKTKLYASEAMYYQDGGMPGSGGMYSYSWRGKEIITSLIKVPLSNLGVEYTGTRYIVDHKKQSDTLIHEIAHQVTGRWLPLLPVWAKEGLAEVISTQPYDNGRFRLTQMDRSIREDLSRYSGSDRDFTMVNLERLMTMTDQEWAADLASGGGPPNYPSANVLFYYFLRLDGEGDGRRLVDYLKALAQGTDEKNARETILMEGVTFAELEERVAQGWRSEGLQLTFK